MSTANRVLARLTFCLFPLISAGLLLVLMPTSALAQEPVSTPVSVAQSDMPDIIGGREATPGAWPWQVALIYSMAENTFLGQFCGGTLIASDWVLTAAHCVDGVEGSLVDVLVGAHRLSDSGTRVPATQAYVHPGYDPYDLDNDLALLHLSVPVTQTPISLYHPLSGSDEYAYMRATVIGWGQSNLDFWAGTPYPDALREVGLPLVTHEQCAASYFGVITDNVICAGYEPLTKGACYGDSGGPLMIQKGDGEWQQIGIVSFGPYSCVSAYGGGYDVFTRVSRYTAWIEGCVTDPDSAQCNGADLHEPDNSAGEARLLSPTSAAEVHTFHEEGDQDWVKFEVSAGNLYLLQTARELSVSLSIDSVIWLYDVDGRTPITYNDNKSGANTLPPLIPIAPVTSTDDPLPSSLLVEDAEILWRADRTGTVYASVEPIPSLFGQEYGSRVRYRLIVAELKQIYLPMIGTSGADASDAATPNSTPTPIRGIRVPMP